MTTPDQQRRINDLNAVTCLMPGRDEVYREITGGDPVLDEATADRLIDALEQFAYPLTEWLVERCGCHSVEAVTVKIGNTTFKGARYKQVRQKIPAGLDPKLDTYTVEAMYLLGELPASYQRSSRTVYTFEGERYEWYVASWASAEVHTSEEYGNYHYGKGPHFLLMPWTHGRIDEHEVGGYKRVAAVLS